MVKNSWRKKIIILFSTLLIFAIPSNFVLADTFKWIQNDWSGGADPVNFPVHPTNQTGWIKFYSKDDEVNAQTDIRLGVAGTGSITQATDADFSGGTFVNTIIEGTGESAKVRLDSFIINDINSWAPLPLAPAGVRSGGSLVYPGSGDYIYAFRGGNNTDFWRYSISNNSWESLAPAPARVGAGGSLVYPGSGDYIYALRGGGTTTFWRYSISNNNWTSLSATPAGVSDGGSLSYPGSGDYIYALRGGGTNEFWRYSISGNNWQVRNSLPNSVSAGGSLVTVTTINYFYALRGGNRTDFWRSSVSEEAWETLEKAPAGIDDGGSLVSTGSDYIYATRGGNSSEFWRYSIFSNAWIVMNPTPFTIGAGGSLVYPGSGDYIYAFRGGNNTDFWRYSISNNNWELLASTPAGVGAGGSLVYPGSGDYIYALRGGGTTTFWRYSISNNRWESLASTPSSVSGGGSLVSPGSGDYLYAFRGRNTTDFWRYSISNNNWEVRASVSERVGAGGSLVYPGSGDYFYALVGNNNTDFLRYKFQGSGTFTSSIIDTGQNSDFTVLNFTISEPFDTDLKFQLRSAPTLEGISFADWYGPTSLNDYYTTSGQPINSIHDGDRFIQYKAYFVSNAVNQTPYLDDITINYQFYYPSGTLTSSPYNSTFLTNILKKIEWQADRPDGTNIKFQLRTAPDNGGIPGDWTDWLGPDGTSNTYFTDPDGNESIPNILSDEENDQWFQYKVYLETSNTGFTPTLSNLTLTYFLDTEPPIISNVSTVLNSSSVIINWQTNEPASTQIGWGLTNSLGQLTPEIDTSLRVTNHSQEITPLLSCTTYYYQTISRDKAGNTGTSKISSFTTAGCLNNSSPVAVRSEEVPKNTSKTISLDNLNLFVPSGASDNDVVFQIQQFNKNDLNLPPPFRLISVGRFFYNLEAFLDPINKITTFNSPLNITIFYTPSEISGVDESELRIYRFDGTDWRPLSDCSINQRFKTVTCSTPELSIFALFGPRLLSSGAPSEAYQKPSPPLKVLINNGAQYTNTPLVTLNLIGGLNTTTMVISNNPEFEGLGSTGQIPYQSFYFWNLCQGKKECIEGEYKVYVKFFTSFGQSSDVVSSSIIYQKEIPKETKEEKPIPREIPKAKNEFCLPYLSKFIKFGAKNNSEEVKKLQVFLRDYEGFKEIKETGIYDKKTFDAVIKFQEKYAKDILLPWGLTKGTGHIYKTTIKKINELFCQKNLVEAGEKLDEKPKKFCPYFTKILKLGMKDPEVKKVKEFLKEQGLFEGIIDNNFDQTLFEAVKKFQSQYSKEILAYWKITKPTGYWYFATIRKANQLKRCE